MLEGKTVNLRVLEKEDLPLFAEWVNNPDFYGEYDYLDQKTRAEIERDLRILLQKIGNSLYRRKMERG